MAVNTIQHNDEKPTEPRVWDIFKRMSGMFGNMAKNLWKCFTPSHLKLHGFSHEVDACDTCDRLPLAYITR